MVSLPIKYVRNKTKYKKMSSVIKKSTKLTPISYTCNIITFYISLSLISDHKDIYNKKRLFYVATFSANRKSNDDKSNIQMNGNVCCNKI